jgi:hypothetical protein
MFKEKKEKKEKCEKKKKGKKGVFGLTAIQSFFSIILGVALLAYVIIIIMGVLGGTTIIPQLYTAAVNESVLRVSINNTAGATLAASTLSGGSCGSITAIYNGTGAGYVPMAISNFSQTGCVIKNLTSLNAYTATSFLVSYPYSYNSLGQDNMVSILANTSTGITGFFSSINPVYAILAVLVIILVLVVLVRVVQNPGSSGTREQL